MQIVWIDVPNDIHDGYETVTRSFRSSLHSLDLRSTELWKRVQICILHFVPMSERSENDEEIGYCERMVSCD